MRQARARTEHNRAQRSAVRTAVKKARATTNTENVNEAIRVLDRGARKGVVHRNAAARKKSRLLKKLKQAS
jgi:small subunit ribosomal protein S20